MRILAIRGKNLASLAGEFDIDFQRPPLAAAGLFAISGPTGAGKSTLLDALCLALFNKTPRLQQANTRGAALPDVGKESLTQQDPRNLLRRGCAEGYAEVEFIGNDQKHYCAHWRVRRAHGKNHGALQATEMTLLSLPERVAIGGKITEVLAAIVERLGLNFDQFTRSVLLAQNEFGVFLKAADDDRASLLETLTGTQAYSQISIRAFERQREEKNCLDQLQIQLGNQQPLLPDARNALETAIEDKQTLDTDYKQQKLTLENHLAWDKRHQELLTALEQAEREVEQAAGIIAAAQGRKAHLQRVELLQPARPLVVEHDRLTQACQQHLTQHQQAEAEASAAEALSLTAEQQYSAAIQQLETLGRQKQAAAEEITQARALDEQLASLAPQHQREQTILNAARAELQETQQQHTQALQKLQQTETDLAHCSDWLQQHPELAQLSDQWPRWDTLFKHATALNNHLQAAHQEAKLTETDLNQVMDTCVSLKSQWDALQLKRDEASEHWASADLSSQAFDADALMAEQQQLHASLPLWREAGRCWQQLTKLQADFNEQQLSQQVTTEEKQQKDAALLQVKSQLPALIARHEQAAKMLDLAKLACSENVEALRAGLKIDTDCPVCGSRVHPYAEQAHPLRDELEIFTHEVQACADQRQQAELQHQQLAIECQQLLSQWEAGNKRLSLLGEQLQDQKSAWASHAAVISLPAMEASSISEWLSETIKTAEVRQSELLLTQTAMTTAYKARDDARQALDQLIQQQQLLQQQLEPAQQHEHATRMRRDNQLQKVAELQRNLQQCLQELDAAFDRSSWQQDWQMDTEGFYARCQQQAAAWSTQKQRHLHLLSQSALDNAQKDSMQTRVQECDTRLASAREAFAGIDDSVREKQQRRQSLLNGRAIVEVEAEWIAAVQAADSKQKTKLRDAQAAQNQATEARTKVSVLQETLSRLQHEVNVAATQLEQWRLDFNARHPGQAALAQVELRQLLEIDSQWLAGERDALQQLERSLDDAKTVSNERRQQCQTHLTKRRSDKDALALQGQLQQLTAEMKTLADELLALQLELQKDDARIQAGADLQLQIDAQIKRYTVWARMNDLIGSADGKKFRVIAQQLTLDILLAYANQHLKDLSRRYRLERVGDTLALQVVDQDMGDEIRSVHSLSGGESFLLSLALALGLASLSSNRVKVESLFIDEGFGSLDADTLRIAMDALDSLQALGRKVGVISHVQEMTERIGTRIEVKRIGIGTGTSRISVNGHGTS